MKLFNRPALVLVLLALFSMQVGALGAPALINGDFEDGFSVRESQEVEVANGWGYSYMSGDDRWCRAPCFRPEYKPEQQIAVSGYSQRWFTTFARQFGTIHQLVDVDAGEWYTFSCQLYAISEPDGQQAVFVGANPWGAGPFARTMIWGEQQPWGSYRQWHELHVTFQAYGGRVLVAVGSNNNYPTKNSAAYVDNCHIEKASGPVPQPTPEPCPTSPPGGSSCDYGEIRSIVREELGQRAPVVWPR